MCECKEKKHDNTIAMVMAIIGIVVVVAGIAFAVYKFITKRKAQKELAEAECYDDDDALIELEISCDQLTEEED